MKAAVLLAVVALAFPTAVPAAENHDAAHAHHHHADDAPQALRLDAGKKWATDAHLRQAMGEINRALAGALPAIHGHRFGDGEYRALAESIREKVGHAVEHCKLPPETDAMLHLILADLLAGAEKMEAPEADSRHDGAVTVRQALHNYGKYFRHPAWKTAGGR